jgi:transcriptional regulator with XRE-family HTH domain
MTTPVTITFDAEAFREIARQAGDETLEQIALTTGLDMPLLSRLLAGKRQPKFATAVRAAIPYGIPMGLAKFDDAPDDALDQDEDAA